jgi:hypothetical protein
MMAEVMEKPVPTKQETALPKRCADGSLDIEHYVKLGRLMRAKAYTRWWTKLWRAYLTAQRLTE